MDMAMPTNAKLLGGGLLKFKNFRFSLRHGRQSQQSLSCR